MGKTFFIQNMMKYIYKYLIILKKMKDETKCYALLSQEKYPCTTGIGDFSPGGPVSCRV